MSDRLLLVADGCGFIRGHLVAELQRQGRGVRVADIKLIAEWFLLAGLALGGVVVAVAYTLVELSGPCSSTSDHSQ